MSISPEQLMLQLGAIGAVLFVVYKLGMMGLDRWSEREKEKNAAIARGFESITTSVNNYSAADMASHERLFESHGEVREAVVRVEAKLDTFADLTPVRGIPSVYAKRDKNGGR